MPISLLRPGIFLGIALSLGLLLAAPAAAEEARNEIVELNAAATEAFRAGDYEQAAELFGEAYEIYPESILLRNQMIATFALGHCEESLRLGEALLADEEIDAADRAAVERIQEDCVLEDEPPVQGEPPARDELHDESVREPVEPRPSSGAIYGWIFAGAGAATLAGAVGWHFHVKNNVLAEYEAVAAEGRDFDRYEALNRRIHTARWGVPALYGVGAAMAAAGLTLALVHRSGDVESVGTVTAMVGPGQVGAGVFFTF